MTQVAFDEATHTYWINGAKAASVTEVIKASGMMTGVEYATDNDRWIGQCVHKMLALFHDGKLNESDIDPLLTGYLTAYMNFLRDTGFAPFSWEKRVAHPVLGFAGTYDVEGRRGAERWLIDFKSGFKANMIGAWVGLQTAGYDLLLQHREVDQPSSRRRFGLKLGANGRYNLVPFVDPSDYGIFLSCLNVYNWRKQHE